MGSGSQQVRGVFPTVLLELLSTLAVSVKELLQGRSYCFIPLGILSCFTCHVEGSLSLTGNSWVVGEGDYLGSDKFLFFFFFNLALYIF